MAALFDVGPTQSLPMGGETAVSWAEIAAYAQATGAISEPWEMRALRDMSAAFARARREGEDIFSIPPADRQSGKE